MKFFNDKSFVIYGIGFLGKGSCNKISRVKKFCMPPKFIKLKLTEHLPMKH